MQQQNGTLARGVTATVILLSAIHAFGARHIYDIWALSYARAAKPRLWNYAY